MLRFFPTPSLESRRDRPPSAARVWGKRVGEGVPGVYGISPAQVSLLVRVEIFHHVCGLRLGTEGLVQWDLGGHRDPAVFKTTPDPPSISAAEGTHSATFGVGPPLLRRCRPGPPRSSVFCPPEKFSDPFPETPLPISRLVPAKIRVDGGHHVSFRSRFNWPVFVTDSVSRGSPFSFTRHCFEKRKNVSYVVKKRWPGRDARNWLGGSLRERETGFSKNWDTPTP